MLLSGFEKNVCKLERLAKYDEEKYGTFQVQRNDITDRPNTLTITLSNIEKCVPMRLAIFFFHNLRNK